MHVVRAAVALPDFAYRAEMPDGTVEHELCPVVIAEVAGPTTPDPDEVDDLVWLPWADVVERGDREPWSLSPWSVEQVRQLADLGSSPRPGSTGPRPRWRRRCSTGPSAAPGVAACAGRRERDADGRSPSSTAPLRVDARRVPRREGSARPWPSTRCSAR